MRIKRSSFATVPTHAATKTMRREELKRKAKPAIPRKLATGANKNHFISCAGAGGSGVSCVNQLTIETVKVAVNITVKAYPNLTIPASKSKRAMSIKAEKRGNPGIKNKTAATTPEDNSLGATEPIAPKNSVKRKKTILAVAPPAITPPI